MICTLGLKETFLRKLSLSESSLSPSGFGNGVKLQSLQSLSRAVGLGLSTMIADPGGKFRLCMKLVSADGCGVGWLVLMVAFYLFFGFVVIYVNVFFGMCR